jgi:hypothetical protein
MAKLNNVWNYLGSTLDNFKAVLLGYRTYKAFISQVDANPPTITVVENTLGINISFEYGGEGSYYGVLDKALFNDITTTVSGQKVQVVITPSSSNLVDNTMLFNVFPVFFDVIQVKSSNGGGLPTDNNLGVGYAAILEITVYNN